MRKRRLKMRRRSETQESVGRERTGKETIDSLAQEAKDESGHAVEKLIDIAMDGTEVIELEESGLGGIGGNLLRNVRLLCRMGR